MKLLIFALLPAVALCQLAGGVSDTTVDPTYEPVVFAAQTISDQLSATNGGHPLSLVEVVHARTQVVAGQNLFLTLRFTNDYICDVTVWYRAWLQGDQRMIITAGPNCTQSHAKRQLLGGVGARQQLSSADSDVQSALDFTACAVNARSNSMYAGVLGDTSGVTFTEQVTAGMTYHFYDVPIVETDCRNQNCESLELSSCQVKQGGRTMTCELVVQFQAWMTPQYSLTRMTC